MKFKSFTQANSLQYQEIIREHLLQLADDLLANGYDLGYLTMGFTKSEEGIRYAANNEYWQGKSEELAGEDYQKGQGVCFFGLLKDGDKE